MGALAVVLVVLAAVGSVLQQAQAQKAYRDGNAAIQHSKNCDLSAGIWVHDPSSHPLYNESSCPFIEEIFNCQKNGRPDHLYLQYRWQPSSCNLPSFRGKHLLLKLRGKRVMFVGDSLGLNQWQSLTCMLYSAVPHTKYTLTRIGNLSTFKFLAFNVSVMLYRDAYLVDIEKEKIGKVLKLGSLENANKWRDNDVLIFNTWHWWLHTGRKQPWDYVQDGDRTYKDMNRLLAYEKALRTWARWVDASIDTTKTKIFFQGVSPDHAYAGEWGSRRNGSCKGEREPTVGTRNIKSSSHPAEVVLERVLGGISKPEVHLLKITALSQLRKDGHPSVYGNAHQRRGNDCTHWCLPGVPDTWNLLLNSLL